MKAFHLQDVQTDRITQGNTEYLVVKSVFMRKFEEKIILKVELILNISFYDSRKAMLEYIDIAFI